MTPTRFITCAMILSVVTMGGGSATAQTLGQGAGADIPWLRMIAALLLCLGLAVGAVWALNRRMNGATPLAFPHIQLPGLSHLQRLAASTTVPDRRLKVVETIRPTPQMTISLFQCDGRDFLVAATAQGQITVVPLEPPA